MKLPKQELPEVEAKIIEVNQTALEEKLHSFQAEFQWTRKLTAVWLEKGDDRVRIRKEGDDIVMMERKNAITWVNNSGIKAQFEKGEEVGDFEETVINLERDGYIQISSSVKMRTAYILEFPEDESVEVVFDTYSDLGGMAISTLMEIEVKSVPTKILERYAWNMEELVRYMNGVVIHTAVLLGFKASDLKKWNSHELEQYHRAQLKK